MFAGEGFVTMGHQVLFIIGSFKFMVKTPTVRVKGLMDLPVERAKAGPEVMPVVTQFMFVATARVMGMVTAEPAAKL